MLLKRITLWLVVGVLLVPVGAGLRAQEPVTLVMLSHFAEADRLRTLEAMIEDYTALHPEVSIEIQTVPFEELLTRIITARTAGTSPDIYHVYNLWLPEFTRSGLLAPLPEEMAAWISTAAAPASVPGVTYDGQLWGVPTEINTYLLLYNKRLLAEAGYEAPPATFAEVLEMAPAITRQDATGAFTQTGFAVLTGWDSGVVHPYMALLFANGGEYFSEDFSTVAFDGQPGVEVLQFYKDLLASGGMDMSVSGWDFANNQVGMVIMANWWRASLKASENIDYDAEIGVAQIPIGPSGGAASTLAYNWLWGVDARSPHQEAAWEFVRWMNTPRAEGESSPMGDFLVNDLGVIPSMLADQAAHVEALGDHFMAPFVASTAYARQEPLIGGSQEIKTLLQAELEALFTGLTDPQGLLDYVVPEANLLLEEFRMESGE